MSDSKMYNFQINQKNRNYRELIPSDEMDMFARRHNQIVQDYWVSTGEALPFTTVSDQMLVEIYNKVFAQERNHKNE